jgi:hypothetical protein
MPRNTASKPKPDADAARRSFALPGWAAASIACKSVYGESYAAAWLSAQGLTVWRPLSAASPADLAIVQDGRLVPLQIRVASHVPRHDTFRASFRRRRRCGKAVRYARGDVHAFVVICPTSPAASVYVVPAAVAAARASGTFVPHRPHRPRKGDYDWDQFKGAAHLLRGAGR